MAVPNKLAQGMKLFGKSTKSYIVAEPLFTHYLPDPFTHVWNGYNSTGQKVVLKSPRHNSYRSWPDFHKELKAQRLFEGSRNLRRLLDTVESNDRVDTMVLEHLPQTLRDVRKNGDLALVGAEGIRDIMSQVLNGIMDMHRKGWVHSGIKARNILLDGKTAKLGDLGFAHSVGVAQLSPSYDPDPPWEVLSMDHDIRTWGIVYLSTIQALVMPQPHDHEDRFWEGSPVKEFDRAKNGRRHKLLLDLKKHQMQDYHECDALGKKSDQKGINENIFKGSLQVFISMLERSRPEKIGEAELLECLLYPGRNERPEAEEILQGLLSSEHEVWK